MGGAWEALVKITKNALRAVTLDRPVYEESLIQFSTEAESTVNRTLIHVTIDVNYFHVITPNHFLIGKPDLNVPTLDTDQRKL